jgi:hypothetical protein
MAVSAAEAKVWLPERPGDYRTLWIPLGDGHRCGIHLPTEVSPDDFVVIIGTLKRWRRKLVAPGLAAESAT